MTITNPLTKEKKVAIGVDILASIDPRWLDDSFIYVHCNFQIPFPEMLIRIWKTTYLRDCHSSASVQLLHAENISYAPQWTLLPDSGNYSFLLIFPSLPKSCSWFCLVEDISQPGGFLVSNIKRNQTDIYKITIE